VTILALAVAAGAVVAGIAADAQDAEAAQAVHAELGYTCAFPSGSTTLPVSVTTTFTPKATAGQALPPVSVRITARLPRGLLVSGPGPGRSSVTGSLVLATVETTGTQSRQVPWATRTPRPVSVPDNAALALTTTGTVQLATPTGPGVIGFTPSSLTIALRTSQAGAPASRTPLTADCVLTSGTQTRLAAITITAAKPSPAPSRSGQPNKHPEPKSKLPKGCADIKAVGTGTPTCGYITGYSDVAKLIGSALLQPAAPGKPALANIDFAEAHKFKHTLLIEQSTGELYYKGLHELPPITATFLTFRFIPVTATLHFTELTPIRIISASGTTAPPYPITVTATTKVALRVTNVHVNGMPLNVGSGCRTEKPLTLTLIGKGENTLPPTGYTVPTGGPLAGKVTVPPFINCGVTENLDPLFTGSISGSGNYVKMTQGKLCGPSQPANWTCPPPVRKAER
jgi:hypothetical protein